jgi:hypothetical protein
MALSYQSFEKARDILQKVFPDLGGAFAEHNPEREFRQHIIIVDGYKQDGGYESVFLNVENITPDQVTEFEVLSKQIPNSPFIRHKMNGITRVGWF